MSKACKMIAVLLFLAAPLAGQSIRVDAPNGGESLTIGTGYDIRWTATRLDQNVKIILVNDGGGIAGQIAGELAPGSSSYRWTVGEIIGGSVGAGRYKVRVAAMDGSVKDISDAAFTVAEAGSSEPPDEPPAAYSITLTTPNGGESMPQLSTYAITWSVRGLTTGAAAISLLKDGAYAGAIGTVRDARVGTFPWTVGDIYGGRVAAGGGYRIRIQHQSGAQTDDSDRDFTITPAPGGGSHDFIVGDPVLEERGGGRKGFVVRVTDQGADYDGILILQHYCMRMGLGHAVQQRIPVSLRRNVPLAVPLADLRPELFDRKCDVLFRFDVNPGRAVAESDYGNNIIQRSFCWEQRDSRFISLRLGRNYTPACEDCQVAIRPADVESVGDTSVRIRLEITVQNCGRDPIRRGTVRVVHSWTNGANSGDTPVEAIEVVDMEQGQLRILTPTVILRRYASSTLNVYFGTGESGALAENNRFGFHPNFVGF